MRPLLPTLPVIKELSDDEIPQSPACTLNLFLGSIWPLSCIVLVKFHSVAFDYLGVTNNPLALFNRMNTRTGLTISPAVFLNFTIYALLASTSAAGSSDKIT